MRGSSSTPLWVLGSTLGYIVLFVILHPISGLTATSLAVFPVMVIGWYFGFQSVLLAGLAALVLNLTLIMLVSDIGWQTAMKQGSPIAIVVLISGAVVGWLREAQKTPTPLPQIPPHEDNTYYRQASIATGIVPYQRDYTTNTYPFVGEGITKLVGRPVSDVAPNLWDSIQQNIHLTGALAGLSSDEAEQRIQTGEVKQWKSDILIKTPSGEERWLHDSSLQLVNDDGIPIGAIGTLQDITDRKQIEEALQGFQDRLKALQAVSIELSKAETLKILCQQAIELGNTKLDFDRLSLWLLDESDPEYMLGTFGTDEEGNLRDEWGVRLPLSHDPTFRDLINGTISHHLWEDTPLHNYRREVVGHGWNAKTTLWGDNRGLGWLAEDNLIHKRAATPQHLEFLRLYGATIGHFIKRKRVEEALQNFQEKLKALQEISLELSRAETLKALCQQAVELGRQQLGFDRLSVWLIDENAPNFMLGTFGTDEEGNLRDEWGLRLPIIPNGAFMEMLSGKRPYFLRNDDSVYDHQRQVVGQGWTAVVVLWGDNSAMGWLSSDNLITRQPITPQYVELLRLYGATLGHFIRRKQVEVAQHEFQDKLKALQTISNELSKAETLKILCQQAIELGRSQLDFDRLGIWLVDDTDPAHMIGTFGIDEDGNLRDEWGLRLPRSPRAAIDDLLSGNIPYYFRQDDALYDHQHKSVGHGWAAMTVLWGDERGMGWLSADNLITRQPITPQHLELLSLYGSTLGHLVKRKRTEETLRAFHEQLKTLQEISLELSTADTFDSLCLRAIELGRSRLGFDRVGIWLVDETDPNYMLGAYGTGEDGKIQSERGLRYELPKIDAYKEMIAGKIPHFVRWDQPLYNQNREVVGHGWNALTVLWGDDRGVGWLLEDNLIKQEPLTPQHLELLSLFGSTLGHLMRRKRVEEALQDFQEKLKTLQEVSLQLSEAPDIDSLCRQAIELGRSQLGFDRISLWLRHETESDHMKGTFGTDEHGNIRDERQIRIRVTQIEAFANLIDGKIPLYVWEDAPLYNDRSEVVGQGSKANTALWADDRGIGWLATDNLLQQKPFNSQTLELLRLYGSTLGHLILRKQAELTLQDFQEKLKTLQEVSLQLSKAETFDSLCRQALELARSQLGFDRIGIWLVDEHDPAYMVGTFGTDEKGELRDERHVRLPMPQSEGYVEVINGNIPYYVWQDAPLQDEFGEIVGQGWKANAVLWGDDRAVGWIAIDNLIKRQPFNAQQIELLRFYGSSLGHLIHRKRAEEALRASEGRYRAMYWNNPSMFFTLDADGTIISVNEFGASRLGFEADELEGQPVLNIFHAEDKATVTQKLAECVQNAGQIYQWQLRKVRKDGSILWVEEFARTIKTPNKELQILIMCQDISERKAAEQQRLELAVANEKVRFLQDFLGSMAHDLKTPVMTIGMNLNLLERQFEANEGNQRIELINRQLVQLTAIIDDVLTIARLESLPDLTFEDVNINQLIQDINNNLSSRIENKRLTVTLDLDDYLPSIHASKEEIHRALLNLLENAIKYTPDQGIVRVHTHTLNTHVVAEITDTGIGISDKNLERIFDEFYRADNAPSFANGTGLGLAITKKIIDLHQGTIDVQSVLDQGTTFRISLPTIS